MSSVRGAGAPVPHKGFSDVYEKMSGKGASASEAHRPSTQPSGLSIRLGTAPARAMRSPSL